jgi:predicted transcriptional regulator
VRNFSPSENKNTDKVKTMVKRGPKTTENQLLQIWKDKENSEKPFHQIIHEAKQKLHLEKRTAINYINVLVENGILQKRVDNQRNTYYKVKNQLELQKLLFKQSVDTLEYPEVLKAYRKFLWFLERHVFILSPKDATAKDYIGLTVDFFTKQPKEKLIRMLEEKEKLIVKA